MRRQVDEPRENYVRASQLRAREVSTEMRLRSAFRAVDMCEEVAVSSQVLRVTHVIPALRKWAQ